MSQSEDEEYGITSVSISDWPDFAMRAVLLDLNPYGRVPKMDTMLGIIDVLSLIKINQFHIFFRVGSTDASYLCYCKRSVNTLKVLLHINSLLRMELLGIKLLTVFISFQLL